MSPEYVRVKLDNGHEKTVTKSFAESLDLKVMEGEETHAHGRLRSETRSGGRPLKPRTTVDREVAKKRGAQYGAQTNAALSAEVDKRNADREETLHIIPSGKTKAALVAALEADDATQTSASSEAADSTTQIGGDAASPKPEEAS